MALYAFLSILTASALNLAFARPSFRSRLSPFPNITAAFRAGVECIPFADPHCCVNGAVCECINGTFFSANLQEINGSYSLCVPPGNVTYGQDTTSIPGFCC